MNNKNLLSPGQMQKLMNLGIDASESSFWYSKDHRIQFDSDGSFLPIFTLSDCLKLLPEYSMSRLRDKVTISCKTLKGDLRLSYSGDSELECAYELLKDIYILEKNDFMSFFIQNRRLIK